MDQKVFVMSLMFGTVIIIAITLVLYVSYLLLLARQEVHLHDPQSRVNDRGIALHTTHLNREGSVIGIDVETLNSFPKMSYSEKDSRSFISAEGNELEEAEDKNCCSICLKDYEESEVVRVIPDCGHIFHVDCIDEWLRLHPTCPVCRTFPLPSQRTSISLPPEADARTSRVTMLDHDSIRPFPGRG